MPLARPRRDRAFAAPAVDDDVHPLVEKRDALGDRFGFTERLVIGPRHICGPVGTEKYDARPLYAQ